MTWQMIFEPARILSILLYVISPLAVRSQSTPTVDLPADPVAFMSLAQERNGLDSADVKPWHIRGAYTFFDKDGKPEDEGTYEEWWVSSNKYKRSFSSAKVKQIEYATGAGLFREGTQDWLSGNEMLLRSNLIEPLPDTEFLKEFKPERDTQSIGKGTFDCVTLRYSLRMNPTVPKNFFPTFCFESSLPLLRLNSPGSGIRTSYSQIVSFQGHYLAREMHTYLLGKPKIDLTLDVIEGMKESPASVVALSPSALPVDSSRVPLGTDEVGYWPIMMKWDSSRLPQVSKDYRIHGTVVMRFTIGKDGHVANVKVISGPPALQQFAVDAAEQRVYRPVRIMGEPTTVEMETKAIFGPG